MKSSRLMAFAATLLILVSAAAAPILAATGSFTNTEFLGFEGSGNDGVCTVAVWRIYATFSATTNDGGNMDNVGWIIVDSNGMVVNWDAESATVGTDGAFDFTYSPQANQVLPVTIYLVEVGASPINESDVYGGTVLDSIVFDAADFVPSCAELPHAAAAVGSTYCPNLPSGSVVGSLPNATRAYYSPGNLSTVTLNAGTYWVIGVDESGAYYKIMLACQYLWLPVDSMQSSTQAPQNGAPLPTRVVS